jgi:hypothetical protein
MMFTKGPTKPRILVVDHNAGSLVRRNPSKPSNPPHVYLINDTARIDRHPTDNCRLKVSCDNSEAFEYVFGGPAATARFLGELHAIILGVDAPMVREEPDAVMLAAAAPTATTACRRCWLDKWPLPFYAAACWVPCCGSPHPVCASASLTWSCGARV